MKDPEASGILEVNSIHYNPDTQIPGCGSVYNVGLNNNGSVPLTNIDINDTFQNSLILPTENHQ